MHTTEHLQSSGEGLRPPYRPRYPRQNSVVCHLLSLFAPQIMPWSRLCKICFYSSSCAVDWTLSCPSQATWYCSGLTDCTPRLPSQDSVERRKPMSFRDCVCSPAVILVSWVLRYRCRFAYSRHMAGKSAGLHRTFREQYDIGHRPLRPETVSPGHLVKPNGVFPGFAMA